MKSRNIQEQNGEEIYFIFKFKGAVSYRLVLTLELYEVLDKYFTEVSQNCTFVVQNAVRIVQCKIKWCKRVSEKLCGKHHFRVHIFFKALCLHLVVL